MAQVIRYLLLLNHPEISDFFLGGGGVLKLLNQRITIPLYFYLFYL